MFDTRQRRGANFRSTHLGYLYKIIPSPIGNLRLVAGENGLVAVLWEKGGSHYPELGELSLANNDPALLETKRQLNEYFAGHRTTFSLKLDLIGTKFQVEVWNALLQIPYGETRSYSQLASQLGNPKAMRAVGAANGRNPIPIIVPCHRVIGSSGKLTGFGGGLDVKEHLLRLESKQLTLAHFD